ncbi:MAG: hypothetical protein DF168_01074 [Candidatus Moanabacter tarae]|uniref:Uncharacterized protein n=1 Tax=Candidatus Moanibacter tarae TaxID=2200854 RepID=A0A2Z4AIE6_9BACT|nr:MAG: hypothetical protein DF168_01074 [Candidatus Moanabacter tarae]|tara:strand:- start:767 stop:1006 length:240 start_codon:yes stop_codon:yes gene_type:complete
MQLVVDDATPILLHLLIVIVLTEETKEKNTKPSRLLYMNIIKKITKEIQFKRMGHGTSSIDFKFSHLLYNVSPGQMLLP